MSCCFDGIELFVVMYNCGKLEEMECLLVLFGIRVSCVVDYGLDELEEIEDIFIGNVCIKVYYVVKKIGLFVFVDDFGIVIDGLNGVFGVYIVDWVEIFNGCDFKMVMEWIWCELEIVFVLELRIVCFCLILVLVWFDGYDEVFEGKIDG